MSTRKIYGVYNTTASTRTASILELTTTDTYNTVGAAVSTACNPYVHENPDGSYVTYYSPAFGSKGSTLTNNDSSIYKTFAYRVIDYKYVYTILLTQNVSGQRIIKSSYLLEPPANSTAYWHAKSNKANIIIWLSDSSDKQEEPDNASKKSFYISGGELKKGSTLLRTETSNSGLTEGPFMQGNDYRWRAYRGSDTIDPTAVTYSTNDLYPNEPVTITVTPVTPTYGGTIYYQYQYSTNGGSTWTNLGSRTTDTSKTMTIPEGATQFRARVTASDGWGFTSTTPVLGANLGVSQLKAFATLDALYRSGVKMYATVDGKIREITKGYATVNGVIRKMF